MQLRSLVLSTTLAAALACSPSQDAPLGQSRAALSGASALAAVDGFAFLPPIGTGALPPGSFSAGFAPAVEVTSGGGLVARFEGLAVRAGDDGWHVNWKAQAAGTYRVRVLHGARELGSADVTLPAGRTLPIKFFTNACAPVACVASDQCHVAGVCDLATATCSNPLAADETACSAGGIPGTCQAGACEPTVLPPANVSIALGDAGVVATFDPSANATGFRLLRGPSANGPWEAVAEGLTGPLSDATPPPGIVSWYAVAALAGSASVPSQAVAVLARPSAPLNVVASLVDGKVELSWDAPTGSESFRVLRSNVADGPYAAIAEPAAPPFTDGDAKNGFTYYYVVRAANAAGHGPPSLPAHATPHLKCLDGFVAGDNPDKLLGIRMDPVAFNGSGAGTKQLKAWAYYRKNPWSAVDVTDKALWSSDAAGVSVANGLVAFDGSPAKARVTASIGGVSAAANVRIWDAARLASMTKLNASVPGTWNMSHGGCFKVSAWAEFGSSADTEDVTPWAVWSGCAGRVLDQDLFVANGGCQNYTSMSTSLGSLSAKVDMAIWGVPLTGTCSDPRSPGELWGITVSGGGTVLEGEVKQFGASGLYSDGATRDISDKVEYGTCNPALLSMSPDGWGTGAGAGVGKVGAAILNGISGVADVTVQPAGARTGLQGLELGPNNANVAQGDAYLLRALARYSSHPGRMFNATGEVSWTSSNGDVTPFAGGTGFGAAIGKAAVTASLGGYAATGNVRVWDPARLAKITSFYPTYEGNMSRGGAQQFHLWAKIDGEIAAEDVSDSSLWWPRGNCYGSMSTTGYFTGANACQGYAVFYTWFGRGFGRPIAMQFGIW